jgi:CHAT domain-containing protein
MATRSHYRALALAASVLFLSALAPHSSRAGDAPPASSGPSAAPSAGAPSAGASRLAEADKLAVEVERLADEARYTQSLELALAVLGIREKELGPDHPKTGAALSDVAALYINLGDDLAAEPLIQRAVKIFDGPQATAGDPADRSSALSNLSSLFLAKKQPDKAKAYATLAFESYKSSPKADPSKLASFESQLALVLSATGDRKGADEHYRAAIAVHEKVGPDRALAIDCIRYGNWLRATAMPRAEMYLEQGYRVAMKSVGPSHPLTAQAIRAFGRAMWGGGPFHAKGLEVYQTAYDTLSGALGDEHPAVADLQQDWAVMRQVAGDLDGSLELRRKADIVEERELERRIAAGTERDALDYAKNLYRRVDTAVGLALSLGRAKGDKEAAKYAIEMVLRRKGQVLDVLRGGRMSLRKRASAEEKKLFSRLAAVRAELAAATLAGPQGDPTAFKAKLKTLGDEEQSLEAQVSAISRIYREAATPVSLAAVQAALPEGSVLLEMFRWKPVDVHARADVSRDESYVVFIIEKHNQPQPFILSDARTVDKLVRDFQKAVVKRDDPFVYDVGRRLGAVLLGRLESALQKYKHVFIAPDGEANLVPFGALVDIKGKLYLQKYAFTYLSSGRDLIRLAAGRPPSSGKTALFANPRYGERGGGGSPRPGGRDLPPEDFARMRFPPLPGTQDEAEAIAKIIPGVEIWTDDQATESAIKAVQSPSVLHIATHGFFLSPVPIVTSQSTRGLELDPAAPKPPAGAKAAGAPKRLVGAADNPMLRSGLAFAGANALASGDEDGILTALEASTLDLAGTDLVVLSACETGVGDVERGQGVFSLRRALVEAGAATQVMSLWEVDDDATKLLMSGYYEKLFKEGKGRTEGLREVQLSMIERKDLAHPFYWAAFIVSGDPSPLNLPGIPGGSGSSAGGAAPGKVAPAARGCGCSVPGEDRGNSAVFYLLIAGSLLRLATARRSSRAASR